MAQDGLLTSLSVFPSGTVPAKRKKSCKFVTFALDQPDEVNCVSPAVTVRALFNTNLILQLAPESQIHLGLHKNIQIIMGITHMDEHFLIVHTGNSKCGNDYRKKALRTMLMKVQFSS